MGFRMPQQPSPQHVQSGLAYTTVGHDLNSCRSIYYSHPRTLTKVDWHYYGGILDAEIDKFMRATLRSIGKGAREHVNVEEIFNVLCRWLQHVHISARTLSIETHRFCWGC